MTTKKGPVATATAQAATRADELLTKSENAYVNAKGNVVKSYENAKGRVIETTDAMKSKAIETRENARDYVKDNPEKSIGIAVGTGVVIGAVIALLASRRR
jgi:ElaB/YqjD/DUF883 family membrane-anchored ribosome-binding protein